MSKSHIVCLFLGVIIKYASTEQEYVCGEGPHNYGLDSPEFAIYQLVGNSTNLTIPQATNQSTVSSTWWTVYKGNSTLTLETIITLRLRGIIETIKSNLSILLENSNFNGIQIDAVQATNNKNKQGNRVTINIGEFPTASSPQITICDNKIFVCVNITGTPTPSTTINITNIFLPYTRQTTNHAQLCYTFNKPIVNTSLFVFFTVSNCFGSSYVIANFSTKNDNLIIYHCDSTLWNCFSSHGHSLSYCSAATTLNPEHLVSTASASSYRATNVIMKSTVHQMATIQSQTKTNNLLNKATNGWEKTTATSVRQSRTTTSVSPSNAIHTDKIHIPATSSNDSCSELPLPVFVIMAVANFVFITLIVIWIIWKFYKKDNTNKKEDTISKYGVNLSNVELQSVHDTANEVYESAKFEFPDARAARKEEVAADHDEHDDAYETAMQDNTAYGTT